MWDVYRLVNDIARPTYLLAEEMSFEAGYLTHKLLAYANYEFTHMQSLRRYKDGKSRITCCTRAVCLWEFRVQGSCCAD